jgi:primosomal protein N' (replication factor Y)
MGTEKVEAAVKTLFPEACTARMDRDTTGRKGAIAKILRAVKNRHIDILVGTQMVAKGHDFPYITLVGIICADLSLNIPDFRAGERTFQLLAQVAGRAGRGDAPGQVFLQSYAPDHFSIQAAQQQDFRAFYQTEIGFRRALNYPPFSRMVQLKISGKDRLLTEETARTLGECCKNLLKTEEDFIRHLEILGPIEASIVRVADRYRWQMLIKGSPARTLLRFIRTAKSVHPAVFKNPRVSVVIDVDPFFMT